LFSFFVRNNGGRWVPTGSLEKTGLSMGDFFGHAVAMTDDAILVGAYEHDLSTMGAGIVFLYRKNGVDWIEHRVIQPEGLVSGSASGKHISIDERTVAIASVGAVYIYNLDEL